MIRPVTCQIFEGPGGAARRAIALSERSSALNQINDQDNDRDHEQQMDQSAAHVSEKPEKPENEEDYKYGPQHRFYFRLVFFKQLCASSQQKDSFSKSRSSSVN